MVKHTLPPTDSPRPKKRAVIWKAVSSPSQAHEEKVSLPEQEAQARKWCEENDYHIIRILEVPGYTRRESDIITALEDFANQGIYAYHDLRRMWQNHEFDVLVALGHDRLGRSNTLHSWVIENVIMNGMQIYFLADGGFVNVDDFRYKLAIGGMLAAAPIDRLIRAAKAAKDKLILQGLPTGPRLPISHRLIRDSETGKAIRIELNEDLRQLFDDLAEVFLEGVAYNLLSKELFERYRHVASNGKPYRANHFYDLLFTPTFWGHLARAYTRASMNGDIRGAWVFDESAEPPAGIIVARNVVPAVYEGATADAIKAEIYRRMDISGKTSPHETYRFSGLFICGECGSSMIVKSKKNKNRRGLKCNVIYSRTSDKTCRQNLLTTHRYLQSEMENLLENVVAGVNPQIFIRDEETDNQVERVKDLQKQQAQLQSQITVLISEQSNAPEAARALYRQQIEQLSNRLERVNENLLTLQRHIDETQYQNREETRTVEELKRLTLECFWNLPDREINKWLRRLMGKRKFVVLDRQIIDVVDLPTKRRKIVES